MASFLLITSTDYKSTKITGAHKRFLELAIGLSRNNKVIIVCYGIPELNNYQSITQLVITKPSKLKLPISLRGVLDLSRFLKKNKSIIIYDYAISFDPITTLTYKIAGFKHVTTLFREDLINYQKIVGVSKLKLFYFSYLEKTAIRWSDKIVVQCENDKKNVINRNDKLFKKGGIPIFVQINNCNPSWVSTSSIDEIKNQNNDETRVLFVGEFSNRRKGQDILFPVCKKMIDDGYKIKLYIVGDGKYLDSYIEQYKNVPGFIFVGRANSLEFYKKCDFLIVPSFIDSCPNVLLEAIFLGLTAYGSSTGGIPDILQDDAFMFEPTENSLLAFLSNLIKEKRYISDKEKQIIIKERLSFDWANNIENIIIDTYD